MVKLAYTPREMSLARNLLLELLTGNSDPWKSPPLADLLTTMRPTREELAAARRVLLGILATGDKPIVEPARSVIRLRAPMHERARARQAVLAYAMTTQNYSSEFIEIIAQLTATTRERAEARRAVIRHIEANPGKHFMATQLLARLVVGPRERSETRRALLSALVLTPSWGDSRIASVAAGLAATAKERSETRAVLMLLIAADPKRAWTYTEAITSLIATKRDRTRTRMMLYPITVMDNESKLGLASLYASLSPARSERADLRRGLLAFLSDPPDPGIAWEVSKIVVQLSPNASERALVRLRLLDELEARDDGWWAGPRIAETLWRLEPGARDRKRLRGALIGALEDMAPIYAAGSEKQVAKLAEQVAKLSPTASDLAAMRKRLLDLAGAVPQYCISPAPETLIQVVTGFKPSAAERKRARSILITAFESSPWKIEDVDFAGILARLAPTQAERMATQNELVRMLYKRSSQRSEYKVRLAVSFAETSLERRILAQALLENLVSGNTGWDALAYADALDYLSTSARDRARIRQELLIALTRQRRAEMIIMILHVIQRLDPTLRIKARARNKILDLLAEQHDQIFVDALTQDNAVQLAPTARDLFAIATLDAYFMTVLMRAARCNSSINEWLALITRLAKTSD
jgi:hypothetical protein